MGGFRGPRAIDDSLAVADKAAGSLATLQETEYPQGVLGEVECLLGYARRFVNQVKRSVLKEETIPHKDDMLGLYFALEFLHLLAGPRVAVLKSRLRHAQYAHLHAGQRSWQCRIERAEHTKVLGQRSKLDKEKTCVENRRSNAIALVDPASPLQNMQFALDNLQVRTNCCGLPDGLIAVDRLAVTDRISGCSHWCCVLFRQVERKG